MNDRIIPEKPTTLNAAVAVVMEGIHRLKKSDTNEHGKYKFVSVDDFKDLVRPLMASNGLSLSMTEIDYQLETLQTKNGPQVNAKITYEFKLRHISGETDEPERATIMLQHTGAQTAGAAKSYAIKEYLKGRFLVSTGDKDMIEGGADADAFRPQEYTEAPQAEPRYARSAIVREAFERLQKGVHEIENTGTLEDLKLFWKNNAKTIAGLPADWRAMLEEAKEEAKQALQQKVAA